MGKSSSPVMGFKYLVAYHHGLAGHPIDAFLEFRAANKTAWSGEQKQSGTISINMPSLFGGDKDQGGIVSDVDLMFGEDGQQPNAYLLSTFGAQVPSWQGVTTLVFKGGEFGAMNPYPQKPAYKIRAILKGWDNDACWYPEKAAINMGTVDPVQGAFSVTADATVGAASDVYGTFGEDYTGTAQAIARQCMKVRMAATGEQFTYLDSYVYPDGTAYQIGVTSKELGAHVGIASVPVTPVCPWPGAAITFTAHGTDETPGGTLNPTVNCAVTGFFGMNPAHVLYEARTAADRGQEPIASMADANWRTGADWFFNNVFGICPTYDPDSESIDDFIGRICKVAGASVSRDPVDGLWYLDIANGVYDLASLPILTDDDILEFEDSPTTPDDAINSLAVEYYDPQQWTSVTTRPVTALSLITANGLNHQTNKYPEIPTGPLANRVALRDWSNAITPTRAFSITTTRKPYAWRVNTYFRLQALKRGIADMVCLLAEKSDGTLKSGAIKLTAAPDIYSLPSASFMDTEPGVDTRPPQIPIAIVDQAAFEAPYLQVVQSLSRADLDALPADVGFAMAVAKDPAISRDFTLAVSTDDDSTYTSIATGPWCPSALVVEGDALPGTPPATSFTLSGGTQLASVVVGQAALWDDEIVRVDAIDTGVTPNTLTLGRGCADTTPQVHAANSRIWFYDGLFVGGSTEYTNGETVDIALLTNTGSAQLDPSLATPIALTFNERQARPYAPGNLKINGVAYPSGTSGALALTWAHRDRITQADQLVDTTQASVGPEAGVTYTVKVYLDDVLDSTAAGIAAATYTPTVSGSGVVRVEVTSQRDGLDSWQPLSATFGYGSPPSITGAAPDANVGDAYDFTYSLSGGSAPFTWSIEAGALPTGVTLNTGTGELTGTPSAVGDFTWTVRVTDATAQTDDLDDGCTISSGLPTQAVLSTVNKASDIVLSSGNTVAGTTSASTGGSVLSASAKTTGKYYLEMICVSAGGSDGGMHFGLHIGTASLDGYLGKDAGGYASGLGNTNRVERYMYHTAAVTFDNMGASQNPVGGKRMRMAVDVDAGKLWLSYINDTAWQGGGDPAAGTSPTFTFTPGATCYFALCPVCSTNTLGLITPANWANAAPTGFGVWT